MTVADDVKLRFTGDAADGERVIAQLERKVESLENRLKRLGQQFNAAKNDDPFRGIDTSVGRVLDGVSALANPINIALQGLHAMNAAFHDMEEQQRKNKGEIVDFAKSLEKLSVDLHGDQSLPLKQAKIEIERISRETGVEQKFIAQAIGTGVGAKGHLDAATIPPIVQAVARAMPFSKEDYDLMTATIADMKKTDPNITGEGGFGFMIATKAQDRTTELPFFVQNVMPAVIGLNKMDGGQQWKESGAIMAAMTNAAQDPSGRSSRTAGVALALQAKSFLQDNPELDTTMKRIEFFQNNEEARKAFLYGGDFGGKARKGMQMTVTGPDGQEFNIGTDRASFERKMFPAIESLLTKGSTDALGLTKGLQEIPNASGADALRGYQDFLQSKADDPHMAVALRDAKLAANANASRLTDVKGASAISAIDRLTENMAAEDPSMMGYFERMGIRADYYRRTLLGGQDGTRAAGDIAVESRDAFRANMPGSREAANWENIANILRGIEQNTKPQPGLNGQKEAGANE